MSNKRCICCNAKLGKTNSMCHNCKAKQQLIREMLRLAKRICGIEESEE